MKKIVYTTILLFCQFCAYTQNWQTLVSAPNKYLNCFYDDSLTGKLFVAGTYSLIGANDYRGIATWNGVAWDSLGAGIDDVIATFPSNTHSICRYGNNILIGGAFYRVGNIAAENFAKWDGAQWDSMFGGQPNGVVSDIKLYNGELFVCGAFDSIGISPVNCISKWDGSTWQPIGPNFDFVGNSTGRLSRMTWYHGNLYVSGMFRDPWGTLCRLAKWNGSSWQFMVSEVQGSIAGIYDMIVFDDELYIGGIFYSNAGNIASGIMRWNDTLWRDVGGSITVMSNPYPDVKDMYVHNGKLYCVGSFEKIGGINARGIASWDGTDWCGYNSSFDLTPGQFMGASCIGFYNDTMYVGGGFRWVNGDSIPYLAKWRGGNYIDTCGNMTSVIASGSETSNITAYPNPASRIISLTFSNSTQSRKIVIYDALGREIWRQESDDNAISISVNEFASGLYFYSIQDAEGSKSNGKFVVAH